MKDIGEKIKDLREERFLSPKQLAEEIGVAKSAIWDYESGKKQIPISHLALLADFFDLSVDYLLDRTEKVIDLDLQDIATKSSINLRLDDQVLDKNEIADAASYIQVKRRLESYNDVNS
ncbi:helix-turn-helix domain-containing protein [Planococcus beigongshangi]|uniref:helix-turn-helix domain-containing protein n=1 Tax=Planococcus beigongshangi TaxID=2782536 RepID=UPI00193B9BD8|nr:helix-turn-helix transcriptional regulator [Planococcus beigongshangi]